MMGVKHKADGDATTYENGSKAIFTAGSFRSLAKVENCPCEDGVKRTAHATAEADTFTTVPACVYVGKKTVGGYVELLPEGWRFVVDRTGVNEALVGKA